MASDPYTRHTHRFLDLGFPLAILAGVVLAILSALVFACQPPVMAEVPTPQPFMLPTFTPTPTATRTPTPTPTRTPTPTPTATPAPPSAGVTPTPTRAPVVTPVANPLQCKAGAITTIPDSAYLPAESVALRKLLEKGGTLSAAQTGWKMNGQDMSTVLAAFVFTTGDSMLTIHNILRDMLLGIGWRHTMDLPEFGHMEMVCTGKLTWGYFQAGELDPLEVGVPGHVLVIYY